MFDELIRRPNCNHFRKSPEFFQPSFLLTSMESAIHRKVKTLAAGKSPLPGLNTHMKGPHGLIRRQNCNHFRKSPEPFSPSVFTSMESEDVAPVSSDNEFSFSRNSSDARVIFSFSYTCFYNPKRRKNHCSRLHPKILETLILNLCIMDTRESVQICCNFGRNVNNTIFAENLSQKRNPKKQMCTRKKN